MTRATRKQKSDFHWCHGLLERMPCSESRLGEANCGVASGWFIFTFLLLSLLFPFSFASQCLVVSEVTSTTPCKEEGFARRIPPFSPSTRLTLAFSSAFTHFQNQKRQVRSPFSVFWEFSCIIVKTKMKGFHRC